MIHMSDVTGSEALQNTPQEVAIHQSALNDHDKANTFLLQYKDLDRHKHSLLAQYVTGIPMENITGLANRMLSDKKLFREKYQLPEENIKFSDPDSYINTLENMASEHNIPIRHSNEYHHKDTTTLANGSLYDEFSHSIYLKENYKVNDLEHELIHALQDINGGPLTIETKEYEAYLCGVNSQKLADPDWQADVLGIFWGSIGAVSLEAHYKDEGLTNPWDVKTI